MLRAGFAMFVYAIAIAPAALPQAQRSKPVARYDLNGEWERRTRQGQKSTKPPRVMILQVGDSIVATGITDVDSVRSGGVSFRGSYATTPFEIEQMCAQPESSSSRWIKETAEVLDARHLRISGECGGKDGWMRVGPPTIALDSTMLFDINGSELKSDALPTLDAIARMIVAKHSGAQLIIAGYTDDLGTDAHNRQLSTRRAHAVADWFASHGFDKSRLTVKGFGEKSPRYPNVNDEARAHNRRVEITINE